jgi:hypothetical protein
MMCRRIHELLSAYIDGELSPREDLQVQEHLDHCVACRAELASLMQTKRLLGALARQRPCTELERLLLIEARRAELQPVTVWDRLRRLADTPIRPRAALATTALSLAALWAATTRLGAPEMEPGRRTTAPPGTVVGQVPIYDQRGTLVATYLLVTAPTPSPTLRLPEPPASRFLEPEPPALLTASWTGEPTRYRTVHFSAAPPCSYASGTMLAGIGP